MSQSRNWKLGAVLAAIQMAAGCGAPQVDISRIERPARSAGLDAYDVFVGQWTWEATMANADDKNKSWSGTAEWHWTLDKRCLHGQLSSKSAGGKEFSAAGIWGQHPRSRQYIWWMFNNWGYPQEGVADYDAAGKMWTMRYSSIGLDGTPSYGVYTMKVTDADTLAWSMSEWADLCHVFKKMEMSGTYKRRK